MITDYPQCIYVVYVVQYNISNTNYINILYILLLTSYNNLWGTGFFRKYNLTFKIDKSEIQEKYLLKCDSNYKRSRNIM